MATKQALMTTASNAIDTSSIEKLTGFSIIQNTPAGTSTRFVIKTTDSSAKWQKYNTSTKTWTAVATQELTAASVIAEGNTADELNAVPVAGMTGFMNKTVHVAAAIQTTNDTLPTIQSFSIKGAILRKTGSAITIPSSLDGYEYENFHVEDGKFVMCPPVVGVALLKTGGGNGTWAHVDEKGNVIK